MAILTVTCPHCHREKIACTQVSEIEMEKEVGRNPFGNDLLIRWTTYFHCNGCRQGICATIEASNNTPPPSNHPSAIENQPRYRVLKIYPKPPIPEAPRFVPDNIAVFFLEAVDSFHRGNTNSCGMACRKVVDASTFELGADPGVRSRPKRFDSLFSAGVLTKDLCEWGKIIWNDGNDASHDPDTFSKKQAAEIISFTEIFLTYVFTLPGMIKERQEKAIPPTS